MRYGIVILPEYPWREASALWKRAEDYGFDHAWTYDHLSWRSLADGPWFATIPTLTAAAMVTSRIRLGTFVASPNFRHPATFIRDILSVVDVSEDRFLLGLGAGGIGFDATVFGKPVLTPGQRVDRLTEFLELLHSMFETSPVSYSGEYFTAVEARSLPFSASEDSSVRQKTPPMVIAAGGQRTMHLAKQHASGGPEGSGWVTTGAGGDTADEWWNRIAEQVKRFESIAGDSVPTRYLSLDTGPRLSLSSREYFADAVGRAEELGFTDVILHWPRKLGIYAADESVLESIASDYLRC